MSKNNSMINKFFKSSVKESDPDLHSSIVKELDRQKMIKKFSDEIFDTIKDRNPNNLINN